MEPNRTPHAGLTPEDRFLLRWCAGAPSPAEVEPAPGGQPTDWDVVRQRAIRNRVAPLLFRNLKEARGDAVPAETLAAFRKAYLRGMDVATRAATTLRFVAEGLGNAGVRWLLLRGPAAGQILYGDTAARPFTDIDLLVSRHDLARARSCLEASGCGVSDAALGAAYFEAYHLHVPYRHGPSGAMIELHWALDHRYVPFTIPYETVLAQSRCLEIDGVRLAVPCPEHDLLAHAIHAAKHAYFVPFIDDEAALLTRVMDEGCLIHFCDIARAAAGRGGGLNWDRLSAESRAWNTEREVSAVLRTTALLFPGMVPAAAVGAARATPSRLERAVFRALDGAAHDPGPAARGTRAILRTRPMFRPVRMLDLVRYATPGAQFVRHRYGCSGRAVTLGWRLLHPLVAGVQLAGNGISYLWHILRPSAATGVPGRV